MSGSIRLFVNAPLAADAQVAVTPAQAHYLTGVMRRSIGDPVRLFNASDGEWRARLASIGRGRVRLTVEALLRPQAAEPELWLGFAVLKRDATELVVQKATELGVSSLLPLRTERTQAERINQARLAAIAVEAAEQSERLTVPVVHPLQPLPKLLADTPAGQPIFAAIERLDAPPLRRWAGSATLLVGPEGGFSPAEVSSLREHQAVRPASLGQRVLRAETACIVGLALLQASR